MGCKTQKALLHASCCIPECNVLPNNAVERETLYTLDMPVEYSRPRVSLLITDLDNTLWDWFHAWHASFDTLLSGLEKFTGIQRAQLEDEPRVVHQTRGTSEYSWLLFEMPSILEFCDGKDPFQVFDDVIHKQNSVRLCETSLYPGVFETLITVKKAGVPVLAYTESQSYWTKWRISKLNLDGVIDTLYSSPDHGAPKGLNPEEKRYVPSNDMSLERTAHHHVHEGISKPNPQILSDILSEFDVPRENVLYIGDSLLKDVAMAQNVGILDAHANYGVAHERSDYQLLRRVSHWSSEDIARERDSRPDVVPTPSYSLMRGLDEVLELFEFKPHTVNGR